MSKEPYGVLILHGFSGSPDCMREIESPLKALGIKIRMPILRGHGEKSPDALRGITWHDWVTDSESALDELLKEVEKVIVIGHSMGGLLALTLAADHGNELESIILAAAAVQIASPIAPGRPLFYLAPLLTLFRTKWDSPPIYADKSLAQYDTNYQWVPKDAVLSLLDFSKVTRKRLVEIKTPTLIIQGRNDSTVAPESAEFIYNQISTPNELKKIVWFEETEHEMFRDCERFAIIDLIVNYICERITIRKS
jgi:carboxylesterase